jgi:diguanylate cyclase (GGDEF)-like protein
VVNENKEPVGIIRESSFKDYAYSRYGQELLQNPAFGKNLERFVDKFPIADIHTSVEKILETYSQNEYLEGIFIVDNMRYVGFLSARSLLRVLNNKNLAIARDQNPLTKLPGNTLIHEYVSKALSEEECAFSLAYFDFDNFKPYNDKFGFRHGDRVILLFSEILKSRSRSASFFAGHVGGDDFFLGIRGMDINRVREIVTAIADQFKRDVESFYDQKSIHLGYIISRSRSGEQCKFPLLTVSAVVVELPPGKRNRLSMEHISNHIARHKKKAKLSPEKLCVSCLKENKNSNDEGDSFEDNRNPAVFTPKTA